MAGAISVFNFKQEDLACEIANNYESWETDRQVWLDRVKEVIQYVYATSTRETSNKENGWSHSTHVPKLTQIHDNLAANYSSALFGQPDFFTFEPSNLEEATLKKRKAIENYLKTKHDYNGWKEVMDACLNDWVQTGNCFARLEYVKETAKDPVTGEMYITYEGPRPVRISPYDIVFNPFAVSFKESPKIFRKLVSKAELLKSIQNDKDKEYIEDAVRRVFEYRQTAGVMKDYQINKAVQRRYDGFSDAATYFKSGMIELLEFVGDIYDEESGELLQNYVITVADRSLVIRKQQMTDYQGFGGFYHAGWRTRPDNLYAQGPLDNLVGMQYLINHLENARADAFDQMLSPDRVHVGNVQIEQDGPVTNYYIDDGNGSVSNLAPDATALQADFQIQVKEAQMEAYAGAPREAMGFRSPGEKTMFEVQQLQNAAMRLFQTRIEQFENLFIEPLLNGELQLAVSNLSLPDVAKVVDKDEGYVDFIQITKDDLHARGRLKARGASHFGKRAVLVQELQQFSNVLLQDQGIAVHFPAKARAKAWTEALQLDRYNMYKPFGVIDEQIEMQSVQTAAEQAIAENQGAALSIDDAMGPLSEDEMLDIMEDDDVLLDEEDNMSEEEMGDDQPQ